MFTVVSLPDFTNSDIADTRRRTGAGWDPGDPVSTNRSWANAVDTILDAVARERPDAVLVAGDLVEGRWGVDANATGIFGPVRTLAQQRQAVRAAAQLYYRAWQHWFTKRRLLVYPAIGDHEIGDNPWPAASPKLRLVPTFKAAWSRRFTTRHDGRPRFRLRPSGTPFQATAYATYLSPDILLVTVEVFRPRAGGVTVTVNGGQLHWLARLLRRTTARTVIVQGHVPVVGRLRSAHSSRLRLRGAGRSAFWRLLRSSHTDLYLAGEMHAVTAVRRGVVEIVHGGSIWSGAVSYVLIRAYPGGRLELVAKRFIPRGYDDPSRLWQTSDHRPPARVGFARDPVVVGRMVLSATGAVLRSTGALAVRPGPRQR